MKHQKVIPLFRVGLKFGILGGGQLARMLAQKGQQLGLEVHIYSESADDPAAQVTRFHHKGTKTNQKTLAKFLACVDCVTFESEFWDGAFLLSLSQKNKFFPNPELMDVFSDRLSQKKLLEHYHIPTASFCQVQTALEFSNLKRLFPDGFVLKKRRFGYDGNGTFINPKHFVEDPVGYIAEALIPFRRECAIQIFRNTKGETSIYPLVETYQQEARCLSVKGPEQHHFLKKLEPKLRRFINKIDFVGTLAFELFDTKKTLIVNEVAPRVHNSGHYSMDALYYDQFEMHIRSGLGLSLPRPKLMSPGFAMWNILGPIEHVEPDPTSFFHWYGKAEFKKGRKLGHLNVLDKTSKLALKRAEKCGRKIKV